MEGTLHLEGTRAREPKIVPLTLDLAGQGNHGGRRGRLEDVQVPSCAGIHDRAYNLDGK